MLALFDGGNRLASYARSIREVLLSHLTLQESHFANAIANTARQ